ncbi:transposase family protein [bacterium]|nr:transposase family protein [bacterium]
MKNLQKENDLLRRQRDILKKALGKLSERSRGIVISIYSDRGCQYAGTSFRQMLERKGIISSMSRKGNCYVNAALESFWSTLKAEVVPFLMGLSRR